MGGRAPEPLTLPKHPELLQEINDFSILVKLHHIVGEEDKALVDKVKERHPDPPTWADVVKLLNKVYRALDEERYSPIKY